MTSVLLILISSLLLSSCLNLKYHNDIINQFKSGKNDIEVVARLLSQYDSDYTISEGYSSGLPGGRIPDDEWYNLVDVTMVLVRKHNLLYVEKYENSVLFCFKAYAGRGLGMVYVSNGKEPRNRYGIIMKEEVEPNWYYCEWE